MPNTARSVKLKLSSRTDRVALMLHLIELIGSNKNKATSFAKHIVEDDVRTTGARAYRRRCMAEGIEFNSVIEAARYLAWHRRDLWENSKAAQNMDAYSVMKNLQNRIRNWCEADDRVGYFWI